MPVSHVTPSSAALLQEIADTLAKARKMVIITGAGISTNSGIPDFRSENGLYSLIQEQFDRAEATARKEPNVDPSPAEFDISPRPAKKRRISPSESGDDSKPLPDTRDLGNEAVKPAPADASAAAAPSVPARRLTRSQAASAHSSPPVSLPDHSTESSESQPSVFSNEPSSETSTQTENAVPRLAPTPGHTQTQTSTPTKTKSGPMFSSSPLSSPPPVLFDPYDNANTTTDSSSQESADCSATSDSESTAQSIDQFPSQPCNSNLRNMKGRDLFDRDIWADPLKTSVFYRFATSLRQRVKEVEPTTTHRFIAQMKDAGKLARVYTQNIDEIEKKIGLSTDLRHGVGNKRKKPLKQSLLPDQDKDAKAGSEPAKGEDDSGVTDSPAPTQEPGDAAKSKPRPITTPDKGVECVFLHGSLHALRCFKCGELCDWDQEGRVSCTLMGEQPECPHCAGATAARQEKGKRALGVGKLRPDIVLYGEEHPQLDLISPIVEHDVKSGPDLLLVLGTSLRVYGLKKMVKEFAKAVHTRGGKVIFVNFTKPSESAWGDVLDYWIEWDCDTWVEDVKTRKPHLWLSAGELQELEKQKRDALAAKKEETLKKREILGEKRRHTIEVSKIRPPPKNPSAMRNDYFCGAYVVWEIFQTLAKIGNRPFDNLGYIPPTPPSEPAKTATPPRAVGAEALKSAPTAEAMPGPKPAPDLVPESQVAPQPKKAPKKPRKSAPATLGNNVLAERKSRPAIKASFLEKRAGKGQSQSRKTAKESSQKAKPPAPIRQPAAEGNGPPKPSAQPPPAAQQPMSSITAAVKSNPRQRKRKVIDGVEVGRPTAGPATQSRPALPVPASGGLQESSISQSTSNAPVSASHAVFPPLGPILPPIHSDWQRFQPARIEPLEPTPVVSPKSPLTEMRPAPGPYSFALQHMNRPLVYSDPFVPYQPMCSKAHGPPLKPREDPTPSPSDQLNQEWEIANELSRMRNGSR
ncbi:hypothetical protein F4780DRAFT_46500 [Xylariomycetidae sp. FL0641]|nr:hypothetical protein F4780DRAFT_46500 [Xylariomycetidae sp. FL0641]